MGQPQDRRHPDPPGGVLAPSALRGAGQPSPLRSPLLHAGPRQREARRRGDRQGRPSAHSPRRCPGIADLDELNTFLRMRCEAERQRVVHSLFGPFTIQDRLDEDLAAAIPLPKHRFDPCAIHPAVAVDKYQTVAFDANRYSVPRPFALRMVTVKGYVDRVVIVADGQARRDPRSQYDYKHVMILDPIHYLATLGRKPGALDHARTFRDWSLPGCFADFRAGPGGAPRGHGRRPAVRAGPATPRRASPDPLTPSC